MERLRRHSMTSPPSNKRHRQVTGTPHAFVPSYPPELPITEWREKIVNAIREHQVLVITGETGSGKSTQIPKFCIEAGRGRSGLIGCTQPRRIAAISLASRVSEEIGRNGPLPGWIQNTLPGPDRPHDQNKIHDGRHFAR